MNQRQLVPDEVLATVARHIREVIDEPWTEEMQITMDTSLQDLDMESIEFVALAEKIRDEFGNERELIGWLGEMELDQIIGLRVGAIVEFICQCRS
jgi:acyl carrier protein